jgi:hypothetical protein
MAENMTKAILRYYPVGCADTTLIELPDGRLALIDFADYGDPDDSENKRIELGAALRERLQELDRDSIDVVAFTHLDDDHCHKSSEFFWFQHAEAYQAGDRVKIDELWVPAAAVTEEGSKDDARIIRQEARHRLKEGKQIRVFSRPERLKDWLEENGLTVESREHLITDAGTTVPGFSTTGEECVEFFVHSPFAWRLDENTVEDRNGDLFTFQARFVIGDSDTRALFFSDADYETLTQIVQITRHHERDDRLKWDIAKVPHHCSYRSLSDEKGDDKTEPVEEVAWLWEEQGQQGGMMISSSKPIPLPASKEDDDPQPPHRQAANYYRPVVDKLDGEGFTVTMEHPNQNKPKPIVVEIGTRGVTLRKIAAGGAAAIISSRPRAG